MRHQLVFIFIVNIIVLAALLITGYSRYTDFRKYHEAIAFETSTQVSTAIRGFIQERQRLVKLFVKNNQAAIQKYAKDVEDEVAFSKLSNKLREHFPDYFAFTLARPDGQLLVDDFDGYIGDICMNDITTFSEGDSPGLRVHPNPHIYHFDMMAEYSMQEKGIFFVSFPADIFADLIRPAEINGHSVYLLYKDGDDLLIEATSLGSRIRIDRSDYRFQPDEIARILKTSPIPETDWLVVDLHNPDLFSGYVKVLLVQLGIIMSILIFASVLMYKRIIAIEGQRRQAERQKDEFFGLMSHEFRTPLTAIIGAIKLVKNGVTGKLNAKTEEMIDIAISNSDRMLLLVNDILDFQKIQVGKMEYVFTDVELNSIVEKAISNINNIAEQKGTTIEFNECESNAIINVDENRMSQAVTNLLSNAIKYGAKNDTIKVVCGLSAETDRAYISITDHGDGISEKDQERIFESFVMLEQNKQTSQSSGLGLAIVKLIAREHAGDVTLHSRPGETCFTIWLPVRF